MILIEQRSGRTALRDNSIFGRKSFAGAFRPDEAF